MELRDVVIKYLQESKKTLSLVDLFNILLVKNLIPQKDKNAFDITHLRTICTGLVNEGVLIENSGKFAYNSDYKGEIREIAETKIELKDVVIGYLKESKKTLNLVNLFNILLVKNLIPHKDRNILEIKQLKEICTSLANEGVLIENSGKFAYNSNYKGEITETIIKPEPLIQSIPQPIPQPIPQSTPQAIQQPVLQPVPEPREEPNALDMMWKYAEYKTNKKLEADKVFNFYAEGKNRGDLIKIIYDFMDYFKIEKDKENLAKWEQHFSNALLIQGVISKWD